LLPRIIEEELIQSGFAADSEHLIRLTHVLICHGKAFEGLLKRCFNK